MRRFRGGNHADGALEQRPGDRIAHALILSVASLQEEGGKTESRERPS
jgi:hypothetical protein